MAKKILAVILTVVMLVSATAVPASAASVFDIASKFEKVVSEVLGDFIGADADADVFVDADFFNAIRKDSKVLTGSNVSKSLSNFAIVKAADVADVDEMAQAIADGAVYDIAVMENGKTTVYVAVDLTKYPELFDNAVFNAAVVKMVDKTTGMVTGDNLDIMDYNRFAGELYIHMVAYQLTAPFKDLEWMSLAADIYEHASVANLNADESRLPSFIFVVIGYMVLEWLAKLPIK